MGEFVGYVQEMFAEFGPVQFRKMFGGHGIFCDGLMIGLIADEMLYLKADARSAGRFRERGCPRFSYQKGDKRVSMSYFLAPAEALEDPSELAVWARLAVAAAQRARR
ncbi:MAG: TfoX/Sxy family protein [Gammaproteobacteria bacterium]|nr:TfoX/Sxy family protein [Gammaproteobacteria bacterium]